MFGFAGTRVELFYPSKAAAAFALAVLLYRRARHRAIGTKHAAVASERLELLTTAFALIKELARVGWHRLGGLMGALRTRDR